VLLQVDATGEPTKHGCSIGEADGLMRHVLGSCPRLLLRGLMAIGPAHGDPAPVFRRVATLRKELERVFTVPLPVLSMGMTGDLDAAIAAGATLVRVGTGIFGPREP
jgi:hypothetical protein